MAPVGGASSENVHPNQMSGMAAQANAEGLLQKGSQFQDRQDLMSNAALAEAAQNFQGTGAAQMMWAKMRNAYAEWEAGMLEKNQKERN